ncbi:unnamed protein product [Toxocara canis]|uniref:Ecotin n=1 Tax=Toxocara canis TaxID=6265 RepID=A0A183UZZ1_TOXCA|nr:unnamed protein product [Toxocara canis]
MPSLDHCSPIEGEQYSSGIDCLDDGIRGPKVAVAQEVRAKRAVIVRRRPIAAVYRAPVYYNQMAYQQPAAYPYQQPVYPYQPAVYAYRRAVYPRRRVWGGK